MRGDVSEALIGAVFLDQGWQAAYDFTCNLIENVLGVRSATFNDNYKVSESPESALRSEGFPKWQDSSWHMAVDPGPRLLEGPDARALPAAGM